MKVISFSLWGNSPIYTRGIIKNCELAAAVYPDWDIWVYVNNTVPPDTITEINRFNHTLVINMDEYTTTNNIATKYGINSWVNGMWRYLPAANSEVELYISRDADSRLSTREAELVSEWINSDKDVHIIRDHKGHINPILAGMFGVKQGPVYDLFTTGLDEFIRTYNSPEYINVNGESLKGIDEVFLSSYIFPKIIDNNLSHVSAGALFPNDKIITGPIDNNFIGNVYVDETGLNTVFKYESGITHYEH